MIDVSSGQNCALPELPENRVGHTQVIFDNILIININIVIIRMVSWLVEDGILRQPVYN